MVLEQVLDSLRKGKDLEEVLRDSKWQTFEELVAHVLEQHSYKTRLHFRFSKGRREIDILAEKGKNCLAIECKRWRGRSCSPSRLRVAAEEHLEKCKLLEAMLERKVLPILVTLLDIGLYTLSNVYVVPVFKLNEFLLGLEVMK